MIPTGQYTLEGGFGEAIRIAVCGVDGELPLSLQRLFALGDQGKLVQTLYRSRVPWELCCAVEADLVQASTADSCEYDGWQIVAGECALVDGITGWLEHDDGWVLLPCSPTLMDEYQAEFLALPRLDFVDELVPYERGRAALGEDSGMRLNRALREVAALETAFAADDGGM